jgi:hypothetical protein
MQKIVISTLLFNPAPGAFGQGLSLSDGEKSIPIMPHHDLESHVLPFES